MSSEKDYKNNDYKNFFEKNLNDVDPEIFQAINEEIIRQQNHIELIALNKSGSLFERPFSKKSS